MAPVWEIEAGNGRTILLVIAHADDMTLFCGGTVARWADAGWRVVVVRVTDDRWDSVGLDDMATLQANRGEFEQAAGVLGVGAIVELGYPTDTLADVKETELREHVIRLIRTYQPYALVSFDPYGVFHEDNQDHIMVAAAVDEAFWCAQFDKHHPEHLARGLAPHGAFERWYFARRLAEVTAVVDVSSVISRKIDAAIAHSTMLRNFANQLQLQARTGGWRIPLVDAARDGDFGPLVRLLLPAQASRTGRAHGVEMAEEWRIVRFGGLESLLEQHGQRI